MNRAQEASAQLEAATLEWIDRFAPYGVIATDRDLQVCSWNHWMERHRSLGRNLLIQRSLI